jgi:hypothetical protein
MVAEYLCNGYDEFIGDEAMNNNQGNAQALTEQQIFDAWYQEHVSGCNGEWTAKDDTGEYYERVTRNAWVAWQARALLAAQPSTLPDELPYGLHDNRFQDGWNACRNAMLSAGQAVQPLPTEHEDFDTWMQNPYTKVLQKSIAEDYVPKQQAQHQPESEQTKIEAYDKWRLDGQGYKGIWNAWDAAWTAAINKDQSQPAEAPKPNKVVSYSMWQPMNTAPKDGTILRLLVLFDDNATEDSAEPCPTIGANSFEHTSIDNWQFAGWDWSQDCFTEGSGEPIGWLPMVEPVAQSAGKDTERYRTIRSLLTLDSEEVDEEINEVINNFLAGEERTQTPEEFDALIDAVGAALAQHTEGGKQS